MYKVAFVKDAKENFLALINQLKNLSPLKSWTYNMANFQTINL